MKKVVWINSSRKDFMGFPAEIRSAMGFALYVAQLGKKHEHAKVLTGTGSAGIVELRENGPNSTYRFIYTVEMENFVFVLHVFQKKSKSGIATPKQELDLVRNRLKEARDLYKKFQKGGNYEN